MKFNYKHTIYASYLGYITQAIINNLAPLLFIIFRDSYGIPISRITFLITINFAIQLSVDLLSSKFVDKIGYRKCIVAAHIFAVAGLLSMAFLPGLIGNVFFGLLISAVLYAIGGGLTEVLISPIVEACPTENKAGAMSLLHSFYCWGTVLVIAVSTLYLHFAGKSAWRMLAVLWSVIPIFNTFFFAKVPINKLTDDGEGMTGKVLIKSKMFWLFVILMISAGASEQAMSQWASAFAEAGLGVSKFIGDLAGPCAFSVLMGISRIIVAGLSDKVKLSFIMTGSGILCIISYLIAVFSPNNYFSLFGCALCGFSVGAMWPCSFSIASSYFPKGGTSLFALLALAGDLGCMSGPTLTGEIAGAMGDNLKTGLLFAIIFPVILIICILFYEKNRKRKNNNLY